MAEERALHESKLQKMEAEMKQVFQQKVHEKEAKLKQSEEELYARHREMKEALEKQRLELEDKKRRIETGRPLTPEKVSNLGSLRGCCKACRRITNTYPIFGDSAGYQEERVPSSLVLLFYFRRSSHPRRSVSACLYHSFLFPLRLRQLYAPLDVAAVGGRGNHLFRLAVSTHLLSLSVSAFMMYAL